MPSKKHKEKIIKVPGFEPALMGYARAGSATIAVYDYEKCVKILKQSGAQSTADAIDYMDYNLIGSYHGPDSPVYLYDLRR